MRKRLDLRRESLAELTTDELAGAVAGLSGPTCVMFTCPVMACLNDQTLAPRCGDITANTC